jgi:hypothetical protein
MHVKRQNGRILFHERASGAWRGITRLPSRLREIFSTTLAPTEKSHQKTCAIATPATAPPIQTTRVYNTRSNSVVVPVFDNLWDLNDESDSD